MKFRNHRFYSKTYPPIRTCLYVWEYTPVRLGVHPQNGQSYAGRGLQRFSRFQALIVMYCVLKTSENLFRCTQPKDPPLGGGDKGRFALPPLDNRRLTPQQHKASSPRAAARSLVWGCAPQPPWGLCPPRRRRDGSPP